MRQPYRFLSLFCLLTTFFFSFVPYASAALTVSLEEGIRQYKQENFEETVEILSKVRKSEPTSTMAAFFLGMAYKQMQDNENAVKNLRDAVTQHPKIKEALSELIDSLYQSEQTEEAKKWIQVAEKEDISPARVSFLKGLILAKENKHQQAIEAFERAMKLEPALTQAAEYQIAFSYIKESNYAKAKVRLESVIAQDPLSDLASFARQFKDAVERQAYLERPLRLTIGVMGGYDTNMLSKPSDTSAAGDITDEKGLVLQSTARIDYVPKLPGSWLFNAQYSAASNINQKHTHSHDSFAQSFTVTPGYSFGRVAVNLTGSYTNYLLRSDPDLFPGPDSNPGYKRYLDNVTWGSSIKVLLTPYHIVELYGGYDRKDYYNAKKVTTRTDSFFEGNRDAVGPRAYVSWIWIFKENAFFNLRYEYNEDHADGIWWDNQGHRLSVNGSIPLFPSSAKKIGALSMQLAGSVSKQDYKHEQPYVDTDGSFQRDKRHDVTYTGIAGLNWEFYSKTSLLLQYTRTRCNANIPVNDYQRDLYMTGFEVRF